MSAVPPLLLLATAIVAALLFLVCAVRVNGGWHYTPLLAVCIGMIGLHAIGAGLLAAQWTDRPFTALQAKYGIQLMLVVYMGIAALLVGAAAATMRLRRTPAGSLVSWLKLPRSSDVVYLHTDVAMLIVGAVAALIMLLYFRSLGSIPLVAVLAAAGAVDPAALRSSATTGYAGNYWRYDLAMSMLLPVVAWYFLVRARRSRTRHHWLLFWIFFLAATAAAVGALVKSPIIIFGGLCVIVASISRGDLRPRLRAVVFGIVAFLIVMPAFYGLASRSGGSAMKNIKLTMSRAATGQVLPGLLYLDYFSSYSTSLGGRGLPNPGGLLGFEPVRVPRVLWRHYFADDAAEGNRLGNNNTSFLFSLFANFGLLGVLCGAVVTGALVVLMPQFILRLPVPPELSLALFALICREAFKLSITSLELSILSLPTIMTIGGFLCLALVAQLTAAAHRKSPHQLVTATR